MHLILSDGFQVVHIPLVHMVKFKFIAQFPLDQHPTQSCWLLYSFCTNLLHLLIIWLIVSSLSPHNLQLLFIIIIIIIICSNSCSNSGSSIQFLTSLSNSYNPSLCFSPRPRVRAATDCMYSTFLFFVLVFFLLPLLCVTFSIPLIVLSYVAEQFC